MQMARSGELHFSPSRKNNWIPSYIQLFLFIGKPPFSRQRSGSIMFQTDVSTCHLSHIPSISNSSMTFQALPCCYAAGITRNPQKFPPEIPINHHKSPSPPSLSYLQLIDAWETRFVAPFTPPHWGIFVENMGTP